MSAARDHILARIRAANGRPGRAGQPAADPGAQLGRTAPHLLPTRAQGGAAEIVDRFISFAEQSGAGMMRLANRSQAPASIAAWLENSALGGAIVASPHPILTDMPWHEAPGLAVRFGRAEGPDAVGVTPALAGIAETGTLLVHSGLRLPNSLHFLPETHIAILRTADIVGGYEQAWEKLRAAVPDEDWPPRTATLITGPSRTSDIEKTLQIGVHGPRRLQIVLIDGEET
ncbi:MAG: LutC/YkgG family protein [Alphaproteobacteria bacterium]